MADFSHRFENEANWKFHEATTGPEIIADFKASGKKLTHWVTGYGTGGTFHGAGLRGIQAVARFSLGSGLVRD